MESTKTGHKISGKTESDVIIESTRSPGEEDRLNCVATAAYFKAEARAFMPGRELDDWLEAEAEFDVRKQ